MISNLSTDLILEQLARNRVFLTDDGLKKLRNAFIIIVGVGLQTVKQIESQLQQHDYEGFLR